MPALYLLIFGLGLHEQAAAQQWDGANNSADTIFRTGLVGIGTNSTTISSLPFNQGVLGIEGDLFFVRGATRTIRGGGISEQGDGDDLTIKAGGYANSGGLIQGFINGGNLFLTGGDVAPIDGGNGGRVEIKGSDGFDGSDPLTGGKIIVNGGNDINSGAISLSSGRSGLARIPKDGDINILSGNGLTRIGEIPISGTIGNSNDVRLLVQSNIGVYNSGLFPLTGLGDRWTSIGDRVPFNNNVPAGFLSTGIRTQWDSYSTNVGLLNRPNGDIKDAIFEWQDLTAGGAAPIQSLDPTTLPQLRFRFRNGSPTNSTNPIFLDVMNLTGNGNIGIGVSNPTIRIDASKTTDTSTLNFPIAYRFVHNSAIRNNSGGFASAVFSANRTNTGNTGTTIKGLIAFANGAGTNVVGLSGVAGQEGSTIQNTNIGVEGLAVDTIAFRNIGVLGDAQTITQPQPGSYTVGVWGNIGVVRTPIVEDDPPVTNPSNGRGEWGVFSTGDLGVTGDFYGPSDQKLKTNFKELSVVERIKQIKTYNYSYDPSNNAVKNLGLRTNKVHYGFKAQELKEVFPELVEERPFMSKKGESIFVERIQAVNQMEMIPIVASALKETIIKVDSLEKVLKSLAQLNTVLTSSQKLENVLAEGLGLSDAIPNPTSERTYLNVTLPANCQKALLTVVNVAGKIVFEQTVEPKDTQIVLEVKNWGAGMYICNLTAPLFKPVVKTVIVR